MCALTFVDPPKVRRKRALGYAITKRSQPLERVDFFRQTIITYGQVVEIL